MQKLISDIPPYGHAIGMSVEDNTGSKLTLKVPYSDHLVGDPDTGVIHGGVITAALDNASGWAVRMGKDWHDELSMATLDIRIDYMKPATPHIDLFVTAECYKQTKTIAFVRAVAYHEKEDDPVATSVATFMMGTSNQPRLWNMQILRQLREEGRGEDIQALLNHIPYANFMGVNVERKGNEITTVLPFNEMLIGNTMLPALHGGAIGSFLELTSVIQLLFNTQCERLPKTVDVSIDYLRSGRPVQTFGRAVVTRQGRRVANVRAEIWQDEFNKPIAASHGHFLLTPT